MSGISPTVALQQALQNPALDSLVHHDAFEQKICGLLPMLPYPVAWHAFHAATMHFGWQQEQTHLAHLGKANPWIIKILDQHELWLRSIPNEQDEHAKHLKTIDLYGSKLDKKKLQQIMPTFLELQRRQPDWLRLRIGKSNLEKLIRHTQQYHSETDSHDSLAGIKNWAQQNPFFAILILIMVIQLALHMKTIKHPSTAEQPSDSNSKHAQSSSVESVFTAAAQPKTVEPAKNANILITAELCQSFVDYDETPRHINSQYVRQTLAGIALSQSCGSLKTIAQRRQTHPTQNDEPLTLIGAPMSCEMLYDLQNEFKALTALNISTALQDTFDQCKP